jgi:hypothetical protein
MKTIQNQTYLGASFVLAMCLTLFAACQSAPPSAGEQDTHTQTLAAPAPKSAEDVLIVDCLLPGQVRKLGRMTYLTPRRPMKSTAVDCEIRGGEYVSFDRSNYATALNVWLGKANEGDATAQNYVGEIYQKGLGLEPQYAMAAAWFRKAAKQGDTRAQINLGYLYEKGLGVEKNSMEAINWYRKATGLDEALTLFGRQKQEELDALRQASERNQQEIDHLNGQLESTQHELEKNKRQVISRNKALEAERKKLGQARRELEAKKKQFSSTDWSQLDGLARQLANRRVNLDSQHVLAAKLRNEIQDLTRRKKNLSESHQKQLLRMTGEMARHQAQLEQQRKESASIKKEIELLEKQKREASKTDQNRLDSLTQNLQQRRSILDEQLLKAAKLDADIRSFESKKQALTDEQRDRKRKMDQELARREAQLEQQRKQGEDLRKEIALLEEKKVRLTDANVADLTRLEDELSLREVELEKKRKETTDLNLKVSQLGEESKARRLELEKLKKKLANLPGPVIEIIDPSLLAIRGIKRTQVKRDVTKRRIIGKVTSAAGVKYVSINGKQQPLEDKGMFQSWVEINPPGPTEVSIQARDSQGKDAYLKFSIASVRGLPNTADVKPEALKLNFGAYHALVIGNDDYQKLPKLKSPKNDAEEISRILRDKYGFQTTTMINASRFEIYTMLDKFRRELTENDNFLIYYAGHGELDVANNRGYWLPIDAEPGSNVNSIPNFTITDILNNMQVKQAIIVADTCYSGILTRSIVPMPKQSLTAEKRNRWLQKIAKSRSRTVLSSGGVKPILDVGFGNHSIFARAFLEILEANNDILEASQLHRRLNAIVTSASKKLGLEQSPLYAANPHAGHKSGDFLFVPKEYQTQMRADLKWKKQ